MKFTEGNKAEWVCDHCLKTIGNTDNEVMFYKTWHFHVECLEAGKPKVERYLKHFGEKNVHRDQKRQLSDK